MSIGFTAGENEFHTTTAHAPHERALPELLQMLTAILDHNRPAVTEVLKWNRDPEEFDLTFHKNGDHVRFEVFQYPTAERIATEREQVFAYEGHTQEIAAAFHQTFVQLHEDRHTDEFEFNWRQPFPAVEYAEFENALKSAP